MIKNQEDMKKKDIEQIVKRLNRAENARYYSHLWGIEEEHNTQYNYEHMPRFYAEYPKVDKITDDFINGWGEFSA